MNSRAALDGGSTAITQQGFNTGTVTSRDGTSIGYRELGRGPSVVLLHGTASSGHNHLELAESLAEAFTVIVPDRRGRGLSGPYRTGDGIRQEIEDLEALLAQTGAHDVFGVSSGGIICLQATLTLPTIRRAAIFEPPFFRDESLPRALLARFDAEMAQGNVAAALITAMRGAQMGPPIFNAIPRWLAERLTRGFMAGEDRKDAGGYVPMRELARTMHYDFKIVAEMNGRLPELGAIQADILLLGGTKSPAYLRNALDDVASVLPSAERVELQGLDHAASWNRDRGGRPEPVARELRRFFASS